MLGVVYIIIIILLGLCKYIIVSNNTIKTGNCQSFDRLKWVYADFVSNSPKIGLFQVELAWYTEKETQN